MKLLGCAVVLLLLLIGGWAVFSMRAGKDAPVGKVVLLGVRGEPTRYAPGALATFHVQVDTPPQLAFAADKDQKAWLDTFLNPEMDWEFLPKAGGDVVVSRKGWVAVRMPSQPGSYTLKGTFHGYSTAATLQVEVASEPGLFGVLPGLESFSVDQASNSRQIEARPVSEAGFLGASLTRLQDGTFLVAGGHASRGEAVNAAFRVDAAGGTVKKLALKRARYDHQALLLPDGRVVLAGGFGTADPGTGSVADLEVYDPKTDATTLIPTPWHTGEPYSMAVDPSGMVLGVSMGFLQQAPPSCHLLSMDTQSWTAVDMPAQWKPGGVHDAPCILALGEGRFLAWAPASVPDGYSSGLLVEGVQRRSTQVEPPAPHFALKAPLVAIAGKAYFFGSEAAGNEYRVDVTPRTYRFDPAMGSFEELPPLKLEGDQGVRAFGLDDGTMLVRSQGRSGIQFSRWDPASPNQPPLPLGAGTSLPAMLGEPEAMAVLDAHRVFVLAAKGGGILYL